jgi:hypothetical protein
VRKRYDHCDRGINPRTSYQVELCLLWVCNSTVTFGGYGNIDGYLRTSFILRNRSLWLRTANPFCPRVQGQLQRRTGAHP